MFRHGDTIVAPATASGGALDEQDRKADEVYEKLFRWAKICAEEGKLVIFTAVNRSCYRLAGEELTAVEVFPVWQ